MYLHYSKVINITIPSFLPATCLLPNLVLNSTDNLELQGVVTESILLHECGAF